MRNKKFDANEITSLLKDLSDDSEAAISVKFMVKNKKIVNEPQMAWELKQNILKMQIPYIEKELEKNALVNYNPLGCMDNEIELVDLKDIIPANCDEDEEINFLTVANEKRFNWGNIDYYVVRVAKDGEEIKLYRQFPKLKRLRKGVLLHFLMDELVQMESDFIGLDENVDILEWRGKLVIFNHIALERIFDYRDIFQENTVKALTIIKDKDIFADVEMFEQDCLRNIRVMKRFTSIILNDRLNLFFENYDKVPEIVKQNNLKIDFDQNGKIVYKDKTELFRITNLMSDAYFKSLLLDRLGVAKLEGDVKE